MCNDTHQLPLFCFNQMTRYSDNSDPLSSLLKSQGLQYHLRPYPEVHRCSQHFPVILIIFTLNFFIIFLPWSFHPFSSHFSHGGAPIPRWCHRCRSPRRLLRRAAGVERRPAVDLGHRGPGPGAAPRRGDGGGDLPGPGAGGASP